jgi:hypothetical protein
VQPGGPYIRNNLDMWRDGETNNGGGRTTTLISHTHGSRAIVVLHYF